MEYAVLIVVLLGIGALSIPALKNAERKRTQAKLSFLTTRLSSNAKQLAMTTATKFPTDYQRLQQQVATDMTELSKLLKAKEGAISFDLSQSAWDLIEESSALLPTQGVIKRPQRTLNQDEKLLLTSGHLKKAVPELWPTLENIQQDDAEIRQKIQEKNLPNQQELLAVHEANMARYQDILDGYLKIKAEPKAYYQAEERLLKSQRALAKFDEDLDETLRQINEDDMMNFEISLRMMNQE
ncbi:hypothetical protein [Streptococcus merionis]|uniref:Membrane associated protein n=1 Tax=Streptococcus merionis TaxID=400065 RepID=A0A239SRM8_9STRE|nr:hypothetical protein [Streptococcus merionis]SNU88080.1 membrane associated protein [Streptococcus merionis]